MSEHITAMFEIDFNNTLLQHRSYVHKNFFNSPELLMALTFCFILTLSKLGLLQRSLMEMLPLQPKAGGKNNKL